MKNILGIIFAFALLLSLSCAHAAVGGIDVTVTKYEPYPVEPGQYFDMWVKVQNVGTGDITNAVITLIPTYPFSLDSTESGIHSIGVISGGQEEVFKFKVRVDSKAVEGSNTIKLEYSYGSFSKVSKDFTILVQTRDAILNINSIERLPENFIPGQVSNLNIVLENTADSALTDIGVKLDLSNTSLPFTTVNTSSEKSIHVIDSGEKQTVSFDLLTFPDAEPSIYKIPLTITYYDNVGTKYTKNEVVSLIVGDVPAIETLLSKTTIKQGGSSGTVTFEIINKGLANIKFLTIELQNTNEFETISTAKLYVGELDSDDTDSFDMTIYVKPTTKSTIDLPLHLQYLDSNNKAYDITENVKLRLYTGTELSLYGLNGGNGTWIIIVGVIALLVAGWFVYNKWIKKR